MFKKTLLILSFFFFSSFNFNKDTEKLDYILFLLEKAYFQGQKDALENDIRIKLYNDTCWVWTKTPWEDGREPIYDPLKDCSK